MCGIAGIVNFDGKPVSKEVLESMHKALSHRGPDDHGIYINGSVGLSHARLSIIDLSEAGRQPMSNEDDSIWIVYNGEIYNHPDIRKSLKNHRFKSNSDTEVLIHLYEEKGIDFIHDLNGMFAIAVYDKRKNKILLIRDRIGIKPLYYYIDNKKFIFASEIKSILSLKDIDKIIDFTAISMYLSLGYIPSPKSAFQKIRKLKQAEYLELDLTSGKFDTKKYWDFKPGNNDNEDEACEKIISLLSDSVRMRLISDVPLGAFLSGGIDSSLIVAFMAKLSNKKPKTFTIGFTDEPDFDETFYAKKVSLMYDTDYTEIKLKYEDVIDDLPRILDSLDEPMADSSVLPTFMVSKATRNHVKVALSGDGGDELFGGYNKYIGMLMQKNPLFLPQISGPLLRAVFKRPLENFDNIIFGKYKRRIRRMIDGMGQGNINRHISWMIHFTDAEKRKFVNFDSDSGSEEEIINLVSSYYNKFENDWINKASYADLNLQLVDDMLTKVDRMSMLTSLEVRVPFLDYRLANEVFGLSGHLKINKGKRKYILLKAAKGLLPKELYNRPKKGFDVPIGPWLKKNKKFQKLFMDCMKTGSKANVVNTENAIRLFHLHKNRSVDYNRELWILFVLKWWGDRYL